MGGRIQVRDSPFLPHSCTDILLFPSPTVDDGTALLDVFCPSSTGPDDPHPPSSAFSLLNPASKLPPRAAPPPSVDPRTSAISTASLAPFLKSASSAAAIAAITARHADLEERARDAGSEETRVGRGRLVRVVGRVEEGRYEWMRGKEGEGRRVVASRIGAFAVFLSFLGFLSFLPSPLVSVSRANTRPPQIADVLTSLTAETSHHLLVARLHKEVYSRPFNLRERLEAIERRRRERKRDAQEVSMMSSTAGGSSYAGDVSMSSVGSSSAGGREKVRLSSSSSLLFLVLAIPRYGAELTAMRSFMIVAEVRPPSPVETRKRGSHAQ